MSVIHGVNYGTPTLDLNFARNKSLIDTASGRNLVTFTRAQTAREATYVGADGLIKSAVANEARFDHNPVTGECLGLLIEEQRSNLLTYSEQFDNAAWRKSSATITSNVVSSPDGTTTADQLVVSAKTNNLFTVFSDPGANVTLTFSVWLRADSATTVPLLLYPGGAGQVIDAAVTTSWQRFSVTATRGTSSDGVYVASACDSRGLANHPTANIYVWGAQLEVGAFPTSYIPTTASTVTRSADFASITGTNFSSWYNQSGGTVYLEDKMLNKSLDFNTAVGFLGPDNNYRILLFRNYTGATDQFEIYHNGQQVAFNIPRTVNQYHKVAVSFKQNDIALSLDGQTPVVDTSATIPPVDRLEFGSNYGTSFIVEYTGTINRLTYYPTRLQDFQLQQLTK